MSKKCPNCDLYCHCQRYCGPSRGCRCHCHEKKVQRCVLCLKECVIMYGAQLRAVQFKDGKIALLPVHDKCFVDDFLAVAEAQSK